MISKFKNTYNLIKESIKESQIIIVSTPNGQENQFYKTWNKAVLKNSENKLTTIKFNGTDDKCLLVIKNQIKYIFKQYSITNRLINCNLTVNVFFDKDILNITCDNPGIIFSKSSHLNNMSTISAEVEAQQTFNRLSQQLIDWFNSQKIIIKNVTKKDNLTDNFKLSLVSDVFFNQK